MVPRSLICLVSFAGKGPFVGLCGSHSNRYNFSLAARHSGQQHVVSHGAVTLHLASLVGEKAIMQFSDRDLAEQVITPQGEHLAHEHGSFCIPLISHLNRIADTVAEDLLG